jgi:hypothetical protein
MFGMNFWTFSNGKCGTKCDSQIDLVRSFIEAAQVLEKKGYTEFTHYIRLSAMAYSKFFPIYNTMHPPHSIFTPTFLLLAAVPYKFSPYIPHYNN